MSTEERKKAFLDALGRMSGNVSSACRSTGVSRAGYYKWRKNDPGFARQCDDIINFFEAMSQGAGGSPDQQEHPGGFDPESVFTRYSGRPAKAIRTEAEKQLTAAMREAGSYSAAYLPLIKAAATQCALMVMAFAEADTYAFQQIETTSTGAAKLAVNPAYEKISKLAESYVRSLARLGLQYDRKAGTGEDSMSDFFKQLEEDD